ncbi:MAG: flagellar export chaperone FlgN [Massilia sp.]
MTRLTRQQATSRLADGVRDDLAAAGAIQALLEQQFDAALRHQSAQLSALAEQLTPLLGAMEQRRQQRVTLVRALLGPDATMAGFIASVAEPAQAGLAAAWRELEALVLECKAATTRNGALLAEQFSVMQRVLHGEGEIYAER